MPKVSVLLFSYNHQRFIGAAIDSVLAQTFRDFELVIIDDDSPDDSWQVITSYDDPRIRTLRIQPNSGAEILYDGIDRHARGAYIAVHNSDDEWLPGKLQAQVDYLDAHPDTAAVFTGVQVIDEKGAPFANKDHFYYSAFHTENRSRQAWLGYFFQNGNCLCHASVLIRTEVFKEAGLATHGLFLAPDFYQWIKICLLHEIYVLPEVLTRYRVVGTAGNISGESPRALIGSRFENFLYAFKFAEIAREDFLLAFPEAKEYLRGGELDTGYALARMMLAPERGTHYQLAGLLLLYGFLNDDDHRAELQRLYGFGHKEFIALSGALDVFRVVEPARRLESTLFYDTGGGFTEKQQITQTSFLTGGGQMQVRFTLPEDGGFIKALRFDPDEGNLRAVRPLSAAVDGRPARLLPQNADLQEEGFDIFLTPDPIYHLEFEGEGPPRSVEIVASVRLLAPEEAVAYARRTPAAQSAQPGLWQRIKRRLK